MIQINSAGRFLRNKNAARLGAQANDVGSWRARRAFVAISMGCDDLLRHKVHFGVRNFRLLISVRRGKASDSDWSAHAAQARRGMPN